MARLDKIITPENQEIDSRMFLYEKNMLFMMKPNTWNVYLDGNLEREMEVGFDKFMMALLEDSNIDPETITMTKFYALLEYKKERMRDARANIQIQSARRG